MEKKIKVTTVRKLVVVVDDNGWIAGCGICRLKGKPTFIEVNHADGAALASALEKTFPGVHQVMEVVHRPVNFEGMPEVNRRQVVLGKCEGEIRGTDSTDTRQPLFQLLDDEVVKSEKAELLKHVDCEIPNDLDSTPQAYRETYNAACRVRDAALGFAVNYRDMIVTARRGAVVGRDLSRLLKAAGFADSRISEVVKIVSAPDEIFNRYAAAELGMRTTLKLLRADPAPDPAPDPDDDKSDVEKEKEAAEQARADAVRAFEHLITLILKKAAKLSIRTKSLTMDGYKLVVSKQTKKEKQADTGGDS